MDKEEILQIEDDDTSKTGMNGKQVYVTKRINGKVTHHKVVKEEKIEEEQGENKQQEDLFVEFHTYKPQPKENPRKKKTTVKKGKKKKVPTKERIKRKSRILKLTVLLTIIIGIFIFAMISPIFSIDNIEVKDNKTVNSKTIISLSGVPEGKNIFQISKRNIIRNIKDNAYINEVYVKRKLPDTLEITVQERQIAYQIKVINSYAYIDYQGYILEKSSKQAQVPLVEGFAVDQDTLLNEKRLPNKDIEGLKILLRIMETAKANDFYQLISKIIIKDNQYTLELEKEKKTVYLGDATNLTNQMTYVKLILQNEKGHKGKIFVNGDINNGFKPYFRQE